MTDRRKPKPKRGNWRVCGSCDGYGVTEVDGTERCELGPASKTCYSCHGKGWRKASMTDLAKEVGT
jgi:DnaJ-class molecular chaperone